MGIMQALIRRLLENLEKSCNFELNKKGKGNMKKGVAVGGTFIGLALIRRLLENVATFFQNFFAANR